MSMADDDLERTGSLLDAFGPDEPQQQMVNLPVPVVQHQPMQLHLGAQRVAVMRDERRVLTALKLRAQIMGNKWYYRIPVRKKGGGTSYIEGPSIDLTNEVARSYMNCFVGTEVEDPGGDFWIIHGVFFDKETGYTLKRPRMQRKSQQSIRTSDSERQQENALASGISKAQRDVVAHALPALVDEIFEEAQRAIVEKIGKNLGHYRQVALETLKELNIDLHRAEMVLNRPYRDWLAPDVARVRAMMLSIKDGMATVDESFPPVETVPERQSMDDFASADNLANKGGDEEPK
jgi:hypothetical protein